MNGKDIIYGLDARKVIKAGIDKTAQLVGVTLGPKGRNVILARQWGDPVPTKDGVTVAKEVVLPDTQENIGAKLCIKAASKAEDSAGDGTTTATILTQSIIEGAMKYLSVSENANVTTLKHAINDTVAKVCEHLDNVKEDIDLSSKYLEKVATISANDSEAGELIAKAFVAAGADGTVVYEETKQTEDYLELSEGYEFDKGWISPYFVTDPEKMVVEYENPYILLWDERITKYQDLIELLNQIAAQKVPLVILADEVNDQALQLLVHNKVKGIVDVVAVKAPGFGEKRSHMMQDLSVLIKGTFFAGELGTSLEAVKLSQLGRAKKVVISKTKTIIINGAGTKKDVSEHMDTLKAQHAELTHKDDRAKVAERISKLGSSIAVIKLGARNEGEMSEKKDRFKDSINATKAALEEGVIPGGGVSLIRAAESLTEDNSDPDYVAGVKIVKEALYAPFKKILENAGASVDYNLSLIANKGPRVGFDAKTGKVTKDMIKTGIIDPVTVTKSSLNNAAGIAELFLTTDALIIDVPDEDKKDPYGGMY